MVGGGIREFVYDADRLPFLERELIGFGVNGYHDRSEFTIVLSRLLTLCTDIANILKNIFH